MNQASNVVCLADSDEEDWVEFSADELNTGIANLYDDDSASDYNDDVEEEDEEVSLDEIEIQQEINQAHAMHPTPQIYLNENSKAKEEKKPIFRSLFAKRRSSSGDNMSYKSNVSHSAFSAAPQQQQMPQVRAKKSKKSQINKRINRLRHHAAKPKRKDKKVVHRQKVNTNVISINLGSLKDAADNIATGDPIICDSCKAIFSKHDELFKQYEDIKLDDEDESIWICQFCNHINVIQIDEEEIPKAETVDYMLAPPPTDAESKQNDQDKSESQIIFCIDISGSMCVSQQIDSKHSQFKLRGNRLQQQHDDLSQFIDHNAGHLNARSDVQYVSRLQCVQTAVAEQIENIAKSNPNYKLGLVSFNNEVTVIGDGMSNHEIITGDKLNNMNKLKEIGESCLIANNIETAKDKLNEAVWKLEENGQTALGPALVVSIAMASAKPGSQVILCTDGLANIGVGSLEAVANNDMIENDDDEEDQEDPVLKWYQTLGDYAMSKGVVVNIISITDDGCKLENLGKIVEITNGSLRRISPLNLAEKFSGIIENESIATNCQAKMLLHPGLIFHNTVEAAVVNLEDDEAEQQKKSAVKPQDQDDNKMDVIKEEAEEEGQTDKMNEGRKIFKIPRSVQDCGNVFEGSRIFFEYAINKEKRKEFKNLKLLPFQTQIEYSKKDGSKMLRVISQSKEITYDRQKVRNNLDFNILAKYGTHVTTELAAKGDYESSRAWTSANTTFLNNNAINRHQLVTLANYAQQNVALDHQMNTQLQRESLQEFEAAAAPQANSASFMSAFGGSKKKGKKKKMKMRNSARDDQFSSHIYNMKKKSHK